MSNSIYQKRVVLFLDILGFKALIERGEEQKIFNVLSTTAAFARSKPSFPELTHATAFSDSIVISHKLEPAGVQNIINTSAMLAWCFLRQGILTRGGIACGDMHHTGDRLFGPAMNHAYKLESTFAKYPRILTSDEIGELVTSEKSDKAKINVDGEALRQDSDGKWHINLMTHRVLSPFIGITDKKELFEVKVETIQSALTNPTPPYGQDLRAQEKHDWLYNYLQTAITEGPSQNPGDIVR